MCKTDELNLPSPPGCAEGATGALDARVKILSTCAVVVGVSFIPASSWTAFAVLGLFLGAVAVFGRLPLQAVLLRVAVVVPFLIAALPLLVTRPGPPVGHVLGWVVTGPGASAFLTVAARATLSLLAAVLLATSTPFPLLMRGLLGLRVPPVLVAIVGFMHRYGWLLRDEAARMRRAAASRSATPHGGRAPSALWRARQVGAMVATLFVRAFDRSERVYDAMVSRGYDGVPRFLTVARLRAGDLAAMGVVAGVVGVAEWMAR